MVKKAMTPLQIAKHLMVQAKMAHKDKPHNGGKRKVGRPRKSSRK